MILLTEMECKIILIITDHVPQRERSFCKIDTRPIGQIVRYIWQLVRRQLIKQEMAERAVLRRLSQCPGPGDYVVNPIAGPENIRLTSCDVYFVTPRAAVPTPREGRP